MFRSRSWFGGGLWKPKNPHSLEQLKYLCNILSKNQIVSEHNRGLLVETLRSIAEILIWGDQNDSTVFDFFLEKNMLAYFLKIMKQKCGSYVCVQLLQTLNILFENIRNETSLYYLLSNNHVNSIIVHKFDFSDEEVMAYYISFLKTLSFKLNTHTIHFFYNEHTNDFPLYTEAIKFFNHPESMVRIACRTLTLNVCKVDDKSMLKFIRDKTAAPYFSNLVWFIGSHVLELDASVRNETDQQSKNRLADLVAEHLDHLHYLNDILCLNIEALNEVLTEHLLNRLLIPLYVYSLIKRRILSRLEDDIPHVSSVVSLFLLSQVFLIITHVPLVQVLAWIILNGDMAIFSDKASEEIKLFKQGQFLKPVFVAPTESLEKLLETQSTVEHEFHNETTSGSKCRHSDTIYTEQATEAEDESQKMTTDYHLEDKEMCQSSDRDVCSYVIKMESPYNESSQDVSLGNVNITDEEKERRLASEMGQYSSEHIQEECSLAKRPFLEALFNALECSENDYAALFALCLLYAIGHNQGIDQKLMDSVLVPSGSSEMKHWYSSHFVEKLIKIIASSCQYDSKVRLATLELAILLLKQLVYKNGQSYLQDKHLALIEGAKEESTLLLRNFYKSEEIFLDMFEDEYNEMKKRPVNVEFMMMDPNILLPPTGTPMSGIEFSKRLPCGEVERARRAVRVFFLIRDLSLTLRMEPEVQLPLTNPQACIQVSDVLDLNNSDLIACTVIKKDSQKIRRFLVIDVIQLILVEPDTKRLGWGLAKFVAFLQDIEVTGDRDDSRCLHITIHHPLTSGTLNRVPLLFAKFVFDDHIRCMAAKQRLTKGRMKARQRKMHMIAKLLELPGHIQPCPSPPAHTLHTLRQEAVQRRGHSRPSSQDHSPRASLTVMGSHRPLFTVNKVPGFAAAMRRETGFEGNSTHLTGQSARSDVQECQQTRTRNSSSTPHSRESSPRMPRPRSEEIPLEDMSRIRTASNSSQGSNQSISKVEKRKSSSGRWCNAEVEFTADLTGDEVKFSNFDENHIAVHGVNESDSDVSTSAELVSRRSSRLNPQRHCDIPTLYVDGTSDLDPAVTETTLLPSSNSDNTETSFMKWPQSNNGGRDTEDMFESFQTVSTCRANNETCIEAVKYYNASGEKQVLQDSEIKHAGQVDKSCQPVETDSNPESCQYAVAWRESEKREKQKGLIETV